MQPQTTITSSEPVGYIRHFKNAATKAAFKAGRMSLADATAPVLVYRGVANRYADSRLLSALRRR